MNSSQSFAFGIAHSLRPALPGLLFAILTLLFGFGLGIVFGLDEGAIKSRLKASAVEVRDAIYHGDDAAMQPVLDKSWVYMQRAHLHAGGLGYSVYWLWAGFRAPALGGTSAAKESLKWLAMPSSGAVLLATVAVAVLVVLAIFRKQPYEAN